MTTPDPSALRRQQLAALALAHLLTLPAPECVTWEVREGSIQGQMPSTLTLDQVRIALHQWAALLHDPTWEYRVYKTNPGKAAVSVTGTYQGQRVEIWHGMEAIPGLTVEELSASPLVDAAAGGEAR